MSKKLLILGAALVMCLTLLGCKGSQEEQIKADYLAYAHAQGSTHMTLDDVVIGSNYGTYNGAVVLMFERFGSDVLTGFDVGGVKFHFNNSNTPLVWKSGEFYDLVTAYDKGLLTTENLNTLAQKINK